MSFVTAGLALAGALAMAVPIIIHLLSRRRRTPIEWAAMKFLLEAFRKHRRRLRIEQLLLLAIRCLVLLLLGMALARPLLNAAGMLDSGSRIVFLVIDNGVVAEARTTERASELEETLETARNILDELGPGDRVGLITAARPAKSLLVPASSDLGAVARLLDDIEVSQAATDLPGALGRLHDAIEQVEQDAGQVVAYLLSSFRHGAASVDTPLGTVLSEPGEHVQLIASAPADEPIENVQVTAIDPVRSVVLEGATDGSGQVTVRLRRVGGVYGQSVSRVRLTGPDLDALEPRPVHWQAGQTEAEVDFVLDVATRGDRRVGVTASIDGDAITTDDARHLVVDLRSRIRVVLLDRRSFGFEPTLDQLTAGQWLTRALDPLGSGEIEIIAVEPAALGQADLRAVDVVIASRPDLLSDRGWALLSGYVGEGGMLILSPPGQANVHQWTERLQSDLNLPWSVGLEAIVRDEAARLADEQPTSELTRMLASEIDRMARTVTVFRALPIDWQQTQAQRVLLLEDGSPFLILGAPEKQSAEATTGLVALLASAPELSWTNLPSQVLMVPLMQELVRQGLSMIRAAQDIQVGDQPALWVNRSAASLHGPDDVAVGLDSDRRPTETLPRSGLYVVRDRAQQDVDLLAVNVDAEAADTRMQPRGTIAGWLEAAGPWETQDRDELTTALRTADGGSPIAGLLLWLVMLLVLADALLARWFSHARVSSAEGASHAAATYEDVVTQAGAAA